MEDFREAIALATEAGQGRLVATLQNNFGVQVWEFDGPAASLAVLREGIAYAKTRGLTESLDSLTQSAIDALVDIGEHDEVLAIAADLGPRLEANGNVFDLAGIRAVQVKVFALRGDGLDVEAMLDWLEPAARGTGDTSLVVSGLGAAALLRAAIGQRTAAAALLAELDAYPGARDNPNYADLLPALVRAGLRIGEAALAQRLPRGLQARNAYAKHALVAANAALTEARGDLQAAAEFLPRCRGSLGAVRGRTGAGVRTPRPWAVLARALPADRGDTRPPTCSRDLLATHGRASARRGGLTPRAVAWSDDETLTTGSGHRPRVSGSVASRARSASMAIGGILTAC